MQVWFRNKKLITYSVWFVILSFVATIFFVWGVGDKAASSSYVAMVNEEKITYEDYNSTYNRTVDTFRAAFGGDGDAIRQSLNIESMVLDSLINRKLLLAEAGRLNIPVSEYEIASAIKGIQSFQVNGSFSSEAYKAQLIRNRLTPASFEASIAEDIKYEKMRNIIYTAVNATEIEIEKEFSFRHSKAVIEYLKIDPKDFEASVKVDDESLAKYYEENKAAYTVPEKIAVKYTEFNPSDYNADVAVTDSEVEAYYVKNNNMFQEPEKVKARHILALVKDWNNKEEQEKALAKMTDLKKQIDSGADFADLAVKNSDDGSAQNGGDLGFFYKGQMVKEFEDAAFGLKPGQVSDIVKTQYGYHLLKVEEHVDAKKFSLNEVQDKIKADIIKSRGNSLFRNYVLDTYKDVLKSSNISAYNASNEKKLKTIDIDFFSAGEVPQFLLAAPNIITTLFNLQKSEVSQIVNIGDSAYIFEIVDKKASFVPELKDIKDDVTKNYIFAKSLETAQETANKAAESGSMDKAAEMLGKTYTTTPPFKRDDMIPEIGFANELSDKIFQSKAGDFIREAFKGSDNVYLVRVKDMIKPDMKDLDSFRTEIARYVKGKKQEAALNSYLDELKAKAEILINKQFMESIKK